jgi:hypothetical protein
MSGDVSLKVVCEAVITQWVYTFLSILSSNFLINPSYPDGPALYVAFLVSTVVALYKYRKLRKLLDEDEIAPNINLTSTLRVELDSIFGA